MKPKSVKSEILSDSESFHGSSAPRSPTKRKHTSWEICLDYAKRNANGEVEVWKDEVGNLLIFASLFSGVAGSFSVEAYHNLKEDPAETTVLLLQSLLALQLNATSPQPQANIPINLNPKNPITASAIRISIYNFLSLILSLSVVMAGILCLQWLREYDQDPTGIPKPRREHLGIRCMRNEGMKKWGVFTVLKTLPLILLLSLLLFFIGIIELLLGVNSKVAIITSIVIGIAAAFMVVTTVLPTLLTFCIRWRNRHQFSQCPWKSPQAWVFYQLVGVPLHFITSAISTLRGHPPTADTKDIFRLRDWSVYDWLVYKDSDVANVGFGIHWLGEMYLQEKRLAKALYKCIRDKSVHRILRDILTWKKDARRAYSFHPEMPSSPVKGPEEAEKDRESHLENVTVFQTLAHLAEKIERGHPPTVLLKQRLDLFFKINEFHLDKDIDCPVVGDMDERVLELPDTRHKLLGCILDLMQNESAGINKSHLQAVNDIFDFETNERNPDIQLFEKALRALDGWIARNRDEKAGGKDQDLPPPPQGFASLLERARQLGSLLRITHSSDGQGGSGEQSRDLFQKADQLRNRVIFLRGVVCSRG